MPFIASELFNWNLSIVHPTLFFNFVIAPLRQTKKSFCLGIQNRISDIHMIDNIIIFSYIILTFLFIFDIQFLRSKHKFLKISQYLKKTQISQYLNNIISQNASTISPFIVFLLSLVRWINFLIRNIILLKRCIVHKVSISFIYIVYLSTGHLTEVSFRKGLLWVWVLLLGL